MLNHFYYKQDDFAGRCFSLVYLKYDFKLTTIDISVYLFTGQPNTLMLF